MSFLWLLEGIRTPSLDKLMQFITYFGQEIIVIAVICTLYWCVDKQFAYVLGFTYFTAGLFVQSLKITFRIPRPWLLDPSFKAVESAVSGATGYSFPSGHTQGATCLFLPLGLKANKSFIKGLCIAAFILIAFSRMYLGCHTPKDVLVSMAVSIAVSLIIWKYRDFLTKETRYLKLIAVILILISFLVCAYAGILYTNGTIETKYASDCFKAAGAGFGFALGWYVERTKLNFDPHTGSWFTQLAKLIIGLLVAVFIKEGFSLLFGTSLLAKMTNYFILVLWVLVFYPLIFSRIKRRSV